MEFSTIVGLPTMRSLSPSIVCGEHIAIDYIKTPIQKPSKNIKITPRESLTKISKLTNKKKKSTKDLALIEALWKQDVDLGVPRELFEDEVFEPVINTATKDKDHGKKPKGDVLEEIGESDQWTNFNFTIDSETGEQLSTCDNSSSPCEVSLANPDSPLGLNVSDEFNLEFNLDEALKFVGINCSETGETIWQQTSKDLGSSEIEKDLEESGGGLSSVNSGLDEQGSSLDEHSNLDSLSDTLDDMIQASQLHPHHPRSLQGRLGSLVRSGEMERWQEVVQYLGLPSPHHHHQGGAGVVAMGGAGGGHHHHHHHQASSSSSPHHPHALYPGSVSVSSTAGGPGHQDHHPGSPAPPPSVPRGVLLNNATLPPPIADPMAHNNLTYTNSMGASSHLVASSMNLTNSTDLVGGDPHYKMEANTSLPSDMMYYQNASSEMNQTTDGLLSSILNDEALGLMDMAMTDYGGRGNSSSEYNSSAYRNYGGEDPHRLPPVAQKKHQMFGKRYFHGDLQSGGDLSGYGSPYPPPHSTMEGATALDPAEMKYSCTMDFRSQGEVSGGNIDHVHHNHTYHMSPEGPSGLVRPTARDKNRSKKHDPERALSRDEKRARTLNLPITCDDIINLPMDEFNERISKYDLTEPQLSLIRDIRRRGKNKVAAQNCRKRKLDQIVHLAEEVKTIQQRKNELYNEYEFLSTERGRIKHKFSLLYRHIFQSLRDTDGNPYSPHEYSLQQSADGSILLVPRSSPNSMDGSSKARHKDDQKQ